jgi:hypothetical protein
MPRYTAAISVINEAGQIVSTRKQIDGDPQSGRAKCVCAKCNNGWMSDLQSRAKPIVLALAQGQSVTLSSADQKLLCAWIAMGTINSEYFNPARVAISDADRGHFWRTNTAPAHWKIWIGDFRRADWPPYRVHHAWVVLDDTSMTSPLPTSAPPNTQTTTLVFGRLYAHAVSSHIPEIASRFRFPEPVERHILHQIWPPQSAALAWPPSRTMDDRDADNVAGYLFLATTGLLWKRPTRASVDRGPLKS